MRIYIRLGEIQQNHTDLVAGAKAGNSRTVFSSGS